MYMKLEQKQDNYFCTIKASTTRESTKSRTISPGMQKRSMTPTRDSTSEDCIAKLRDSIENDLQLQSNIENAHRIGTFKNDVTTRPVLAKFLYRPERFKVIKKKRDLRDSVCISDDLIWEDHLKKKQLKSVMKEAFETGKRPRFHYGKLYIEGELHQA